MATVRNAGVLLANAQNSVDAAARRATLALLEAAIAAVDPRTLVARRVRLAGDRLSVGDVAVELTAYDRIVVVGGGKASGGMAEALEAKLGHRITAGLVNVPRGTAHTVGTRTVELNEGGHPIPDDGGHAGVRRIMALLRGVDEATLVILLLSGGGSALLPLPPDGLALAEKQQVTNLLLRSGATIEELNVVRKHLSAVKGGHFAVKAYPATLLSLILSDVVGDPVATIASGPTAPDPSTYTDAVEILRRYHIWSVIPSKARDHLRRGETGREPETPKPGDPRFRRVHNVLLGNNRIALQAAERKARAMGFNTLILSTFIEGEARHVGSVFAGIARELAASSRPVPPPAALFAGGETTVTVTGPGRGGRNQELVLQASKRLAGLEGLVVASIGTDGVDGSSDAAGAIADGATVKRAAARELNLNAFLAQNDSHHFFRGLGDHLVTGPTGTNVNDITLVVHVGDAEKVKRLKWDAGSASSRC
jgi:glycerate-2-kinase